MDLNIHEHESLLLHWTKNLVESPVSFTLNFSVALFAGILYSFKVVSSDYLLFIFGVVSPIIFTVCLYDMLLNSGGKIMGQPLPNAFSKPRWGHLVMAFDCLLIILFAALIHFNILNYFLFRFLQTVFFPILLLIMLKGFFFIIHQH